MTRLIAAARACLALFTAVVWSAALIAQAPATAPAAVPPTTGPGGQNVSILHLNVADIDRSLALWRDALGFVVTTAPTAPRANAGLVNEPGAMIRTTRVRAPGGTWTLELVEWTGTPLRPQQPRIQDPGAIMLAINVSDIDARLAAVRQVPGVRVLTAGGTPYVSQGRGGQNSAVMVQDENGFIVELVQNQGASGPISNVNIYLTVADLAQTVDFYNKVIGFTLMPPAAAGAANERVQQLFNNTRLNTMRAARGTFPGSDTVINFQEFGATDRRAPLRHRVQDPGGPIFTMTVKDFAAVIAAVSANGGIVGEGETSVMPAATATSAWVRDPNGLLIRMSAPNPGRAGGAGAAGAPPAGRQ